MCLAIVPSPSPSPFAAPPTTPLSVPHRTVTVDLALDFDPGTARLASRPASLRRCPPSRGAVILRPWWHCEFTLERPGHQTRILQRESPPPRPSVRPRPRP